MKLKVEKKEFDSIGGKSAEFSVDTENTMIIRLLRDKMYKNKIGAVAREIASNSRDANREAGKGTTPITIEIGRGEGDILSDSETYISFKDSGIGITPDRMENIFLKYGGSTKRDSDKFTGGFGIGAKTPFAYTDNFFIITVAEVDGKRMKYYYQSAITSDGNREVSQMVSLGEEETTDHTGTEITVPINQNDSSSFMREVLYATSFWKVKPTLKGFDRQFALEVVHDGKANYSIIKDVNKLYGDSTQYIALIDGIPYVLDMNQLKNAEGMYQQNDQRGYHNSHGNATGFITVFEFETADITVSGSREDIEYVEDNIKAFTDSNNKMKDEVKGLIEKYLGEANTYYERCVKANSISSANYRYGNTDNKDKGDYVVFLGKLASSVGIKEDVIFGNYKGEKVVDKHSFSMHEMDIFTISGGKMKKSSSLGYARYGDDKWDLPIYYLDLAKSEPARNAMLKSLHSEKGYVLIKEKKVEQGMGARTTQEEEQIVKEKGFFKLIGLSEKWKKYTEVEKLRKEKGSTRNVTDIVKVSCRYLRNPNAWNVEWMATNPQYDKKNGEFVNLVEDCQRLDATTTRVAYFEVEKLTDLNGTGYSSPHGFDKDQTIIHKLLKLEGVMTLGVSKSKVQYFEKAKIKSMEETFVEIMKAKAKDDILVKSIDFSYASSNKANQIYFALDFGKDVNKKIAPLKKLLKFASENKTQMERYSKVVQGIGTDFAEKYKVGVSKEITDSIVTLNLLKKDNPLIALVVELESQSSFRNKLSGAKTQLTKLFKNQKE